MAKFKKGDRVRCVKRDYSGERFYEVGEEVVVGFGKECVFYDATGGIFYNSHWELATPSPIPDTVTIGGVEYVRKPEPEHVWAWGQWARVKEGNAHYSGQKVFIVGGVDETGRVPFTSPNTVDGKPLDGFDPCMLEYIGTATIPE